MTNAATTFPTVVFDERMMLPGHTLVLIAATFVAMGVMVFGSVRIWQHRRTEEVPLTRRLMLATGILVLALAVADTLISIARAVEIKAMAADPAAAAGLFGIAVAQQLRFVCAPVIISGIAFALAVAMGDGPRKESPTRNRTIP